MAIAIPFSHPKRSAESVAFLDACAFERLQNEICESYEVRLAVAVCACVTAMTSENFSSVPTADDE